MQLRISLLPPMLFVLRAVKMKTIPRHLTQKLMTNKNKKKKRKANLSSVRNAKPVTNLPLMKTLHILKSEKRNTLRSPKETRRRINSIKTLSLRKNAAAGKRKQKKNLQSKSLQSLLLVKDLDAALSTPI
jgi:hypothetical protein